MLHLLVALVAAVGAAAADAELCYFAGPRVDCGYKGITQDVCEAKGCCWLPAEFKGAPNVDLPWCFHHNTAPSEYKLTDARLTGVGGGGVEGTLRLRKAAHKELGPDIEEAALSVEGVSEVVLRVKITDAKQERWEIPTRLFQSEAVLNGSAAALWRSSPDSSKPLYEVSVKEEPFSLKVLRQEHSGSCACAGGAGGAAGEGCHCGKKKGGRPVFDTEGLRLIFKDQYIEMSTWVDKEAFLFGAGERSSENLHLLRNGMPLTIWSHDIGPTFLLQNMYGSHPFVMAMEADGSSWGALLFNSNGMDVVATEDRLSWRVIGGVIDLFIFMGPTPLDVMDQFTWVVGRPAMMPYWSLGFHQCKYGYKSVWEVEEVVANYSAARIPLDTIWTDIDHMDKWKDFTLDPVNFPLEEMQRFVAKVHASEQKWVPIIDPGIKIEPGYPPYDRGIEGGLFMQDYTGSPYVAQVWPGACHFPDFFNPKTQAYFHTLLSEFHDKVPWDGIWCDMDEVSNFCTGDACQSPLPGQNHAPERPPSRAQLRDDPPWVCHLNCSEAAGLDAAQRKLLDPPYPISNYLQRLPLGTKTMSVVARHYNGDVQYNTHNLYGLSEIKATSEAIKAIRGKRPFVLSRASFTGLGAYGAHWTGDDASTWHDLVWSLPGIMNIGLFGMPMGGADACGFMGETTEELCSRWIAAAAFQPLSRDHADLHSPYQELYRWPIVAETARRVLGLRYRLLPYLYTAFHAAHEAGSPVMRPLFMNFPADPHTYPISRQFMVGDVLLVTPVMEEGARQVSGYFPPALWYSAWDKEDVIDTREGGRDVVLDAPVGTVPVHVRGGSAVPMQAGGLTTAQAKRSPLTLVLALAEPVAAEGQRAGRQLSQRVEGHMYNDDGESVEVGTSPCNFLRYSADVGLDPLRNSHAAQVDLRFGRPGQAGACQVDAASAAGEWEWPLLSAVEVWGWQRDVVAARVEVLLPQGEGCNRMEVMQRAMLEASQVVADGHGLKVDLQALNLKLECPYNVRISWESSAASGPGAVLQSA